jgi:cell shape-determining protein MreC
MPLPQFTSRRWFWMLTLILLAWAILSTKIFGGNPAAPSPPGRRAEAPFREISNLLLTPVSAPLTRLQTWLTHFFTTTPPEPDVIDCQRLRDENEALKQEAAIRNQQIDFLNNKLLEARVIQERFPKLSPQNMLTANVTGYSGSAASAYCTLDKGTHSGVLIGDPVLLQWALLGRVISVGELNCTVHLLTDRNMKVEARVARMGPQGSVPIADSCLVHGNGNNSLRCDTIEVHAIAPQKGDLLILNDKEWPLALQGAIIGQVQDVRNNENQPLRFDLRIDPTVTIHSPGTISIVLMTQ